jgi:ectoine hydroxylase-related dioxygenase (phytanoyl-CoA dioxygenase family)
VLQLIKSIFARENQTQPVEWKSDGYLILKSFFGREELRRFENEVEEILENRRSKAGEITIDVLEGQACGQRLKLADAPDEVFDHPHKINDLYLESRACRDLALNTKLCLTLNTLLGGTPLIINSLTFTKGSQQPHHFDTYYMPPPVLNKMVVSSICLEDQSEESGPLSYYPGSHRIPPYRFSHGGIHAVAEEMADAEAYITDQIEKLSLERKTFVGQAGDVFIWHGQLYHGGLPIRDQQRTRKTLVTHYWRAEDVEPGRVGQFGRQGSYLKRGHQTV